MFLYDALPEVMKLESMSQCAKGSYIMVSISFIERDRLRTLKNLSKKRIEPLFLRVGEEEDCCTIEKCFKVSFLKFHDA